MHKCLPIVPLLALLVAANSRADDAVKRELKRLEGTWLIVSDVNDGKEMPAENAKKIKLTFAADGTWAVTLDGKVVGAGTTRLDQSKKPKTVDYSVTEGGDKGSTFIGIYELDGDTFRHCGVTKGKAERPTEFSSKPGSGQWLVTFRREKK